MKGGEIFVPKIPSYNIIDLLKAVDKKPKYKIIGVRPGEKLHEELITESDSLNTQEFKEYFIINSSYKIVKNKQNLKNTFSYNSRDNIKFLKPNEIKKLIDFNIYDFEQEN